MHATQFSKADRDENSHGLDLLVAELNHRIRNLLTMIEAAVRQTQSTSVEGYRTKLIGRISALSGFYQLSELYGGTVPLVRLLEETTRLYSTAGARVLATGPDIELEPKLALALHLVFHELAANAHKYGALSSPLGNVSIEWVTRSTADANRKLTIVWTEHGGPAVKRLRHRGFGSTLIRRALEGYGAARLDFHRSGVACLIFIDLGRDAAQIATATKGPDRSKPPGPGSSPGQALSR